MRISVIIPVYNAEQYLSECIGSVLSQTMSDFELLLIDDGSRDSSGALCDRYAAGDDRIRVFHLENGGASRARNFGLDNARGEFVVFIDSDDWVEPGHLQQLSDSGIGEDGIAFSNIFQEHAARKGNSPRITTLSMPNRNTKSTREACMQVVAELLRNRCFGWTCNKMFSRRTIEKNNLRFDSSIHYAEDEVFTAQYCAHITHIVTNSCPTYHYRYVQGSMLHRRQDPQMLIQVRRQIFRQYEIGNYSHEVLYLAARTQFSRLRRELRHARGWNSDLANQLAQEILDNWQHYQKHTHPAFRTTFYDTKVYWIGTLACAPGSCFWVKLIIKGLHL